MKILDLSAVTDSARLLVKEGTLQFLQDAPKEVVAALVQGLIGPTYNAAAVYVLWGAVNSGAGSNYVVSAGAAFYNGEIFLIDAASFTLTGAQVAILSIGVTQYTTNADPVTFTDTTVHNIHNIRKIVVSAGAAGSTFANYLMASFVSFVIPPQVVLTGTAVTGAYPNYNVNWPVSSLHPILAVGSTVIGDVPPGGGAGNDFAITFATVGTAAFTVLGTVVSNGTPANDSELTWSIRNRTATGFTVRFQEQSSVAQNITFDWVLIQQ